MKGRTKQPAARPRRASRCRAPRECGEPDAVSSVGACDPLPETAPRTLRDAALAAEALLDCSGVAESVADARLLLAHALGASPTWVFAHEHDELAPDSWDRYRALVTRRALREPLQHLVGQQEFWSLRLAVGPDVLIPRPETELLVEAAIEALGGSGPCRLADVGTGSGAVALAACAELPLARVTASDVSAAALAVARANAKALGLDDRVTFVEGVLAAPLRDGAPYDAVLANLPYVTEAEWESLEPEVRDHEPRLALVAGPEGTELVRELVAQAPAVLRPGGLLALEVGHSQADAIRESLERAGFAGVRTRKDLAGVDRVVQGTLGVPPAAPR